MDENSTESIVRKKGKSVTFSNGKLDDPKNPGIFRYSIALSNINCSTETNHLTIFNWNKCLATFLLKYLDGLYANFVVSVAPFSWMT